jgi:hypothetical protein
MKPQRSGTTRNARLHSLADPNVLAIIVRNRIKENRILIKSPAIAIPSARF